MYFVQLNRFWRPLCAIFLYFFIEHTKIRSTEEAVRGRQYGPCPSIQPEKRSFEGCIDGFRPY